MKNGEMFAFVTTIKSIEERTIRKAQMSQDAKKLFIIDTM